MIDMTTVMNNHYFWITALYILGGVVAYVAGFFTCFFFCNYNIAEVQKGGHCGIRGDWIPDEVTDCRTINLRDIKHNPYRQED